MKISKIIAAAAVTVSMMAMPLTASANFFPADRQTYTCITPTNCPGADHVQFNSFTNNPVVGDERAFFAGSLNGANVADRIKVKNGDVITLRAYIHNNADATKMGSTAATVAKNVKFKVLVPTASQKDTNLIAFISADNANPGMVNDTMSLYADSAFTVKYVPGSAKFSHAADGVNQKTVAVNDSVVGDGAILGDITGCFAYSGYVTLQVKVTMPEPPTPPKDIKVCELSTKKVISIKESEFDAAKHSKDLSKCDTPPVTPPELPNTGAGDIVALFAAVTAAGAIAHRYVWSRRNS